ncbi:MAG TPA: hypothetical protein VFU02_22260, partial [Polyangiaceae bacterium]|nr:hypothetical protein [Polyangiaceae bacterium]
MYGELEPRQLRQFVRLIASSAELEHTERALHVLSGVRQIIGATTAGSLTDCDFAPGGRGAYTAVTLDGWDTTTIRAVEVLGNQGSVFHPCVQILMETCPLTAGGSVTGTRQRMVDDRTWYGSQYVEDCLAGTNLDHGIFSCV